MTTRNTSGDEPPEPGVDPRLRQALEHDDDDLFAIWVGEQANFATAVRVLRRALGITAEEAAAFCGLSPSFIYRIEKGERQPERDTEIALLLAGLSLPTRRANPLLVLGEYAPIPARWWVRHLSTRRMPPHLDAPST